MTTTATAIKDTTATMPTTDTQIDVLSTLPDIFADMPKVPDTITQAATKKADKPQTLEALKEAASVERMNVEHALKTDSRTSLKAAMDKAQEAVKAYNSTLLEQLFAGFLRAENPILAFMTQGFYKRMSISTNDGKEGTTVSLNEKDAFLPLARFVTFANTQKVVRSASWQSKVQRVTALLSIRAAQDIGQDVSQMLVDFDMDEKARGMVKKDVQPRAKNPISNGTLTAAMQDMLDDVFYIDNGKDQNQYRIVSATLHYFMYILFKRGSKPGTIATPRKDTVENYLVEIAHMMVNNIDFAVEYDKVKTVEKNAA